MTDYSDLKLLAEAATPGPWKAQHPNAGQRGSEVAGADGLNQVCAELGPTNSLYIAAANPAAVLALIAENERLNALWGGRPAYRTPEYESKRDSMWRRAHMVAVAKGYDHINMAIAAAPKACTACDGCGGEWQSGGAPNSICETCKGSRGKTLEAENVDLRKDAERYRWLKDKNSDPSIVSSSEKHAKYFFEFMLCGDDLDTVIDAAMSKKS